ncbi:MAG TPA: glycosyltransferase family 4 protein [Gaiellaceae bacterium]|nr:glycosyltransferase family 4 protein [Gaiellaceae bacterium]
MTRPRLLIVITLAETGGAQQYVAQLLPALPERFDVVVAAHGTGPLREAAKNAGVRFVPLRHVRRSVNPIRDALGLVELIRLCRRERPHIVHANSSKAGTLARLAAAAARVPIRIFTVHGWAFRAHAGLASRLYLWADRLVSPLTTLTICVSASERSAGIAARTCRAGRTVVIPNVVDVNAAQVARLDGAPSRVISVGRLKAPKDFVTLTRALARVSSPYFEAQFVGDGPDRATVEAEADTLGLDGRLRLLGDRADVPALLARSDVFVLSSTSEGMPVSVAEAMAAGLPVVATAVGGVAELVVDGETGFLVPPRDAGALAAAITRLLADPVLRRRMGSSARSRAEAIFDLDRFRAAHLDVYRTALARIGLRLPSP